MRLEDMSFTDYLMAECDLRERQRKERMKQAEFEKYAKEHNLFVCSTDVIKQIRKEISLLKDHEQTDTHTVTLYTWKHMQEKVLQIIDKYAKGESE